MYYRRRSKGMWPYFILAFAIGVLLTLLCSFKLVLALSVIALVVITCMCIRC